MSIHHTQLHNDRKVANTATSSGYSGNDIATLRQGALSAYYNANAPTGTAPDIDVDNEAIKEPHKIARDLEQKILNLSMRGDDLPGLMANATSEMMKAKNSGNSRNNKKDKEKSDLALHLMLLNTLDRANAELLAWNDNLNDALAALRSGEDLSEILKKPGVSEAIEEWEERTGKTFDPNDPNARDILDDIIEQQIEANKQQVENNKAVVREMNQDMPTVANGQFANSNLEEAARAIEQRADITIDRENLSGDDRALIESELIYQSNNLRLERAELETADIAEAHTVEIDEEVGRFMKIWQKTQSIDDPDKRLGREQRIVEKLSDEARDFLKNNEDTKHLFEEDYFSPLEQKAETDNTENAPDRAANHTANLNFG